MADSLTAVVPPEVAGERLDKVVALIMDTSRAEAAGLVSRGVTVDGELAQGALRVREGQQLVIPVLEATANLEPEQVAFEVHYEDEHLVVVDKPAGVVVHPGAGRGRGTLAAGLLYRFPELAGVGEAHRWGLVHRLDKDTSGLLVVARSEEAYINLNEQMRRRDITRVYTALVEGRLSAPTGTIDAPIDRDPTRPTRKAVAHGGRPARTHFELIRYFDQVDASLLEVRLETGRTHQIRVHMSAIGHPVVGDSRYGSTRRDLRSPRTFLHASRLEFVHPVSAEQIDVKSPLPPDLQAVLDDLSSSPTAS